MVDALNSVGNAGAQLGQQPRLLGLNSQGKDVAAVQQRLTELGFDTGEADGKLGTQTEAAVKAFQTDQGLKVDGIVGPLTRAALANPKVAQAPQVGGDVAQVAPTATKPKPTQADDLMNYKVSANVSHDLESASHDWTARGYYNDIRSTLAEAKTPADFVAIATAARAGRLTRDHADTIEAIATAGTGGVRDGLRDAYADPGAKGEAGLAAARAAAKTPGDFAAIRAVASRLQAEGLITDEVAQSAQVADSLRGAKAQIKGAAEENMSAMQALAEAMTKTHSAAELQHLDLQITELSTRNTFLFKLGGEVDHLAHNPKATEADHQQLEALVGQALATHDATAQGKLMLAAGDLVRNAGRVVPSDRGLYQAQQTLNLREGEIRSQMSVLAKDMIGAHSATQLQSLQLRIYEAKQMLDGLDKLQAQATRLADTPKASHQDTEKLTQLLMQATRADSAAELTKLQIDSEDTARNAGRAKPSDRALFTATQQIPAAQDVLRNRMASLAYAMNGERDAGKLQLLQIKISQQQKGLEALDVLKARADHLADDPDASPGAIAKMTRLLNQIGNADATLLTRLAQDARAL